MRPFKFFRGVESRFRDDWYLHQVYQPLQLTQVEPTPNELMNDLSQMVRESPHNIFVHESIVDWARMAIDIREQSRVASMINRPIEIPEYFQHRGRRPRNPY